MSETDICGSTDTTTGEPCQFSPGSSCPWHDTENPPDNGRDSKLTKQREEQIAQAIERGKSLNSAARMADVTPQTVYNWLDRGEGQEQGVYRDFFERIAQAKGYGEDFYFTLALKLARENQDHRFIASLMKQRYPDSWGDTDTGVDADIVDVNISEEVASTWPE
jgi:hypothetical protein